MILFYQISLWGYTFLVQLSSLFNEKARLWVSGRKDVFDKISQEISDGDRIFWFHCASLGEYEQGKPLIEKLKEKERDLKILVTFFSPSGYEYRKDDPLIDYCYYLPVDNAKNANRFLNLIKPEKAFFIKYEFWYYYLKGLNERSIPTYLVSGVFRATQLFFKSYGKTHQEMLTFFTHFYVQNERSKALLETLGHTNITIAGDTRIDRVYENSLTPEPLPLIQQFKADKRIIIAGSSWQPEEKIICDFILSSDKEFKYIIAPHDVSKSHISQLENLLGDMNYLKYSEANEDNIGLHTILIIDSIGILANTYQYTDIALIGGGFKGALHNVLEPASFGNVVMFGKKHSKFHEAEELLNCQAAYEVSYTDDLIASVNHLLVEDNMERKQQAATGYIKNNVGVTDIIIKSL